MNEATFQELMRILADIRKREAEYLEELRAMANGTYHESKAQ